MVTQLPIYFFGITITTNIVKIITWKYIFKEFLKIKNRNRLNSNENNQCWENLDGTIKMKNMLGWDI